MTLSFDPKEELRLRMADLEQKLAESEEERCKLEKTCNVLMRAFKEEEKIRYKTLNKNYEKFLQDCTVRKRRNDIILRSLCRIEDRSRALFAKTERLKLLKDRYISYLKISDIKDGISPHTWKTLPASSLSQKINEVTPKFVQWKNPLAADHKAIDLKDVEKNSLWNKKTSDARFYNLIASNEKYNQEQTSDEISKDHKTDVLKGLSLTEAPAKSFDGQNKLYSVNTRLNSPLSDIVAVPVKTEKSIETINPEKTENYGVLENKISNELEVKDLFEIPVSKERNNMSRQESVEKLRKVLSFKEKFIDNENIDERHDPYDKKITEKDDLEQNEENLVKTQNNSHNETLPRINHYSTTSSSSMSEGEKQDNHAGMMKAYDVGMEMKTGSPEENLPMGLDGVDYQNETYPESYYEQPVHRHNNTSIVADVILEEDETDQDVDEEKKSPFDEAQLLLGPSTWKESPGQKTDKSSDRSKNWSNTTNNQREPTDKVRDIKEKAIDEVKSQEFNLEKPSEVKSSDGDGSESKSEKSEKSERLAGENLQRKKNVRSNLIHLLESDSESFQIEHGDTVSGNEDSDFDFSFH